MDELLSAPWAVSFSASLGRNFVKDTIKETLDELRGAIRGGAPFTAPLEAVVAEHAQAALQAKAASSLRPVVNATGVVVHTNIGRAPLAPQAQEAVASIAGTYSTLEYSLETGGRGNRNAHVEWLVRLLTGAEAALVVNNNAAAVLLALSSVAAGREVVVSSGELVEIGDSFRIPQILSFAGAKMLQVGCTNSTTIRDYSAAITENTAALLKVHPSNYRIEGFVKTVQREELARLAAAHGLVCMEDLGSGLLCKPALPFAQREQSVRDCVEAGVDIVTFSGDKLLGGPQIGVIAGKKELVDKMRRHQLLRALRVDKMTLAAFEATLRLYLAGRQNEIPVIRMLEATRSALLVKARRLCRALKRATGRAGKPTVQFSVVETDDAAGGGAFPTDVLPGYGVAVVSLSQSPENLAVALRTGPVPIITGLREGKLILHVRTLLDNDEKTIVAAFSRIFSAA
jgi:L-seryl-tRNA(Ser) seleniumtransferase